MFKLKFLSEKDAIKAYNHLNGRYYAKKKIFCYFTHVKNWFEAVCGQFLRKKCTRIKCKYLHVFQNPYREFEIYSSKYSNFF